MRELRLFLPCHPLPPNVSSHHLILSLTATLEWLSLSAIWEAVGPSISSGALGHILPILGSWVLHQYSYTPLPAPHKDAQMQCQPHGQAVAHVPAQGWPLSRCGSSGLIPGEAAFLLEKLLLRAKHLTFPTLTSCLRPGQCVPASEALESLAP